VFSKFLWRESSSPLLLVPLVRVPVVLAPVLEIRRRAAMEPCCSSILYSSSNVSVVRSACATTDACSRAVVCACMHILRKVWRIFSLLIINHTSIYPL